MRKSEKQKLRRWKVEKAQGIAQRAWRKWLRFED
jgi:hypothetical protein